MEVGECTPQLADCGGSTNLPYFNCENLMLKISYNDYCDGNYPKYEDIPKQQIIERIEHYDAPHFSWEENRSFRGAYYPIIKCKPYWSTDWLWIKEEKISRKFCTEIICFPYIPIKTECDDEVCLKLANYYIGLFGRRIREKNILAIAESPYYYGGYDPDYNYGRPNYDADRTCN